jgi:hypothetical protein
MTTDTRKIAKPVKFADPVEHADITPRVPQTGPMVARGGSLRPDKMLSDKRIAAIKGSNLQGRRR